MSLDEKTTREISQLLEKWYTLKKAADAFKQVDKQIKNLLPNKNATYHINSFVITVQKVEREDIDKQALPPEIKEKYKKITSFYRKDIKQEEIKLNV